MMRRSAALLCALLLLFLSGCGLQFGDSLYALPKASDVYKSLELCLQSVLDSGLEYSAPISGTNARSVHLQDLDNDGEDEAIGFFRSTTGDGRALKIYLFKKDPNDKYQVAGSISGEGSAINSAITCQFMGGASSTLELVVSWQVSGSLYALSAYSLAAAKDGKFAVSEMMSASAYSRYAVDDLDSDGNDELVLLSLNNSDAGASTAHYLDVEAEKLVEFSSTPLSSTMAAVNRVNSNTLRDGTPALFVTGYTQSDRSNSMDSSQEVTDVLALREGTLSNVTMDPKLGYSAVTTRANLAADQDINGDGAWEIPYPETMTAYRTTDGEDFYAVHWSQYDLDGSATAVCTTYYNSTDGWFLILPDEWEGRISLARSDTNEGITNERGIVFYYSENGSDPVPFLAIYKNTGNDRTARATSDGRMLLLDATSATYAAKFLDQSRNYGIDSSGLLGRFRLIITDWSTS